MERRILQPEQIIVPGEYELGNESILKIYFRIFDRGHGKDLPPVVVVNSGLITKQARQERLQEQIVYMKKSEEANEKIHAPYGASYLMAKPAIQETEERYRKIEGKLESAPYYLIDGNHRTAAAALTHSPISALELQGDGDFEEIKKMIERGKLFDFKRPETSLQTLVLEFENCVLKYIECCKTIRERIDELISNGNLPPYMKERYHRRK